MMVLAWIGKPEDGAHTRRGVHGIPDLTMGCVSVCGEPAVTALAGFSLCTGWECWGDVRLLLLVSLRTVLRVYCVHE